MEVSGNLHATAALSPERNQGTHWVGTRTGPDILEKRKISSRSGTFITFNWVCVGKKLIFVKEWD